MARKKSVEFLGPGIWTCPANVFKARIRGCGGGGAGGSGPFSGSSATNSRYSGGGGGAGSKEAVIEFPTVPGEDYAVAIGPGGVASGLGDDATDGGDTTVTRVSTATVVARIQGASSGMRALGNSIPIVEAAMVFGGKPSTKRGALYGRGGYLTGLTTGFDLATPAQGGGPSSMIADRKGGDSPQGYVGGAAGDFGLSAGSYYGGWGGGGGGAGPYGNGGAGGHGRNQGNPPTGGLPGSAPAANSGAGGGGGGGAGMHSGGAPTGGGTLGANGGSGRAYIEWEQ